VVQFMLEYSSPDQQRSITRLLCSTKNLLTLASDRLSICVAQACLPHLTPNPTTLLALVNYTAMLGQHQYGIFFLQRLVGVLSTRTQAPELPASCTRTSLPAYRSSSSSSQGARLV